MPLLPATVRFPEPGSYARFWDADLRRYLFLRLVDREYPLKYPRRLPSVATGAKTSLTIFRETNPSAIKKHIYNAYIGVKPGALFTIYHPSDVKLLSWDESIVEISIDLTASISWEESPYEAPTKSIWMRHDKFPAFEALNVTERVIVPELIIVAAKYLIQEEEDLDRATVDNLRSGNVPSLHINFGGQF